MTEAVHGFFYVAEHVSDDISGLRRAVPSETRSTIQQLVNALHFVFPIEENFAIIEIICGTGMQFIFHLDLDGTD